MAQAAIAALLRRTVGLDAAILGSEAIARAVRQRMAACGVSTTAMYLARLQTTPQELAELIEQVVVPETWFFRDQEPFAFLGRYVQSTWLPTHRQGVLRVLSVPCATGEEPYSIAMTLLEAGVAPQQVHIDAVDISARGLRTAQRAVYTTPALRGVDLALRQRYFEPAEEGYRLRAVVSGMVHFMQGSILAPTLLAAVEPYEVIFCRNLLIYFDPAARRRTLQVVERLLKDQGLLFVGYAETGLPPASRFAAVPHPRAFAFHKREDGRPWRDLRQLLPLQLQALPQNPQHGALAPLPARDGGADVSASPTAALPDALDTARQLADQGRLADAAALCETHLRTHAPSAPAYHLLGLIRQAAGNHADAERCFNRAVYLAPDDSETLLHLALLVEHRGDTAAAAVLRQRAKRRSGMQEKAR